MKNATASVERPNEKDDDDIAAASVSDPAPPGCPPSHIYVPHSQRTPLIHSAHTSLSTGDLGTNQTPRY